MEVGLGTWRTAFWCVLESRGCSFGDSGPGFASGTVLCSYIYR